MTSVLNPSRIGLCQNRTRRIKAKMSETAMPQFWCCLDTRKSVALKKRQTTDNGGVYGGTIIGEVDSGCVALENEFEVVLSHCSDRYMKAVLKANGDVGTINKGAKPDFPFRKGFERTTVRCSNWGGEFRMDRVETFRQGCEDDWFGRVDKFMVEASRGIRDGVLDEFRGTRNISLNDLVGRFYNIGIICGFFDGSKMCTILCQHCGPRWPRRPQFEQTGRESVVVRVVVVLTAGVADEEVGVGAERTGRGLGFLLRMSDEVVRRYSIVFEGDSAIGRVLSETSPNSVAKSLVVERLREAINELLNAVVLREVPWCALELQNSIAPSEDLGSDGVEGSLVADIEHISSDSLGVAKSVAFVGDDRLPSRTDLGREDVGNDVIISPPSEICGAFGVREGSGELGSEGGDARRVGKHTRRRRRSNVSVKANTLDQRRDGRVPPGPVIRGGKGRNRERGEGQMQRDEGGEKQQKRDEQNLEGKEQQKEDEVGEGEGEEWEVDDLKWERKDVVGDNGEQGCLGQEYKEVQSTYLNKVEQGKNAEDGDWMTGAVADASGTTERVLAK
ncbi:hypothetical protein FPV67DRAFT_1449695 [Lyophyllum atratum]|nr:hypothetical protein FPV67DRAFT_1449695 [Lyophyllum atratum]